MRSVTFRLAVAFAGVALVGVLTVALLATRLTTTEFDSYLERGWVAQEQRVADQLADYYSDTGGWRGVAPVLASLSRWLGQRVVVGDNSGRVVADSAGQAGQTAISNAPSDRSLPIAVQGKPVGKVYLLAHEADCDWGRGDSAMGRMDDACTDPCGTSPWPTRASSAPQAAETRSTPPPKGNEQATTSEQRFLDATNRAVWLAGGGAASAALLLGLLISRQITAPLHRLTRAAHRVAAGNFHERVDVGSKDELASLAAAFNTMAGSLAAAEQQRKQLFSDIAHELKTPISIVQANLEAMIDGVAEATPERLASLREETLLLNRLVTDLRDLSLAEAGQLHLHTRPVELNELVTTAAAGVQAQARDRGVRLELALPEKLPRVAADPDRVGQVLRNLLSNALRYTPDGGTISVTAAVDGVYAKSPQRTGLARVTVSDTGPGIPPEDLPNIFERFYRVDKSRSRAGGGSGLGLAVARQFVEAHKGRIWAESNPGKGATFHFTLPLALDAGSA